MVEADESDRSLLKLAPEIAVVTNAELDHHATYGSRAELDATFRAFLGAVARRRSSGTARRCSRWSPDGVETVPYDAPDAQPAPRAAWRFRWREHEVALRGARRPQRAQRGRRARGGAASRARTRRRRRRRSRTSRAPAAASSRSARTPAGARVYDDYAHHPTEVRATIEAARTSRPRPRRRRVPAAPLLADGRARTASSAPRSRRRTSRWCSTSTRRASAPRTTRGSSGLLVAEAAADAAARAAGRVDAELRRRRGVPARDAARRRPRASCWAPATSTRSAARLVAGGP